MRFGNREVMEVVFKDLKTHKPLYYFETLTMSQLDNKQEKTDLRAGMANPTRMSFFGNKDEILECEDGLISPESWGIFTGTHPEKGLKIVHEKESLEVKEIPSTVTNAPAGAKYMVEIAKGNIGVTTDRKHPVFVFKGEKDGASIIKEITRTTEANKVTKGTYEITDFVPEVIGNNSKPSVPARLFLSGDDFNEYDIVIIDYYVTKLVTELVITSKDFPKAFYVEGWTLFKKEEDGLEYPCKVTIPKAQLSSDFQISMKSKGDPGVYKFKLTALAPINASRTELIRFDLEDEAINND